MDIYQHIGKTIIQRRKELGLTRNDLASNLNITHQQFAKYELCQNRIPVDRLLEVAELLEVSVDELLNLPPWVDRPYYYELNREMEKLSKELQEHFLAIIKQVNKAGRG